MPVYPEAEEKKLGEWLNLPKGFGVSVTPESLTGSYSPGPTTEGVASAQAGINWADRNAPFGFLEGSYNTAPGSSLLGTFGTTVGGRKYGGKWGSRFRDSSLYGDVDFQPQAIPGLNLGFGTSGLSAEYQNAFPTPIGNVNVTANPDEVMFNVGGNWKNLTQGLEKIGNFFLSPAGGDVTVTNEQRISDPSSYTDKVGDWIAQAARDAMGITATEEVEHTNIPNLPWDAGWSDRFNQAQAKAGHFYDISNIGEDIRSGNVGKMALGIGKLGATGLAGLAHQAVQGATNPTNTHGPLNPDSHPNLADSVGNLVGLGKRFLGVEVPDWKGADPEVHAKFVADLEQREVERVQAEQMAQAVAEAAKAEQARAAARAAQSQRAKEQAVVTRNQPDRGLQQAQAQVVEAQRVADIITRASTIPVDRGLKKAQAKVKKAKQEKAKQTNIAAEKERKPNIVWVGGLNGGPVDLNNPGMGDVRGPDMGAGGRLGILAGGDAMTRGGGTAPGSGMFGRGDAGGR